MAVVLSELKVELETDPMAYGYAPHITAGEMQALADMVNLSRAGIDIERGFIAREEILQCWDLVEIVQSYNAHATGAGRFRLACFAAQIDHNPLEEVGSVRIGETLYHHHIAQGFQYAPTSLTNTALVALTFRQGARSEELWGAGVFVTWGQCHEALAL